MAARLLKPFPGLGLKKLAVPLLSWDTHFSQRAGWVARGSSLSHGESAVPSESSSSAGPVLATPWPVNPAEPSALDGTGTRDQKQELPAEPSQHSEQQFTMTSRNSKSRSFG